jgi:DNA (cytosine-5)-methyltransferase 1
MNDSCISQFWSCGTRREDLILGNPHLVSSLACVDLFCGAGGLTHGLLSAGIPVVAGVDLDETCRFPYEANNPGATFHARDVAKIESSEIKAWLGPATTRILAGCAPCQPFSSYSQRYETKGTERWGLLNHFSRLVKEIRPEIVTMENVPTVIKHSVFRDFVTALRHQGYKVWHGVIDCSRYGLPQRRRRTVLLAALGGPISLVPPSNRSIKTVREALAMLPAIGHGSRDDNDPLHCTSRLPLSTCAASRPRERAEHGGTGHKSSWRNVTSGIPGRATLESMAEWNGTSQHQR